jgi:hypothetical protein
VAEAPGEVEAPVDSADLAAEVSAAAEVQEIGKVFDII